MRIILCIVAIALLWQKTIAQTNVVNDTTFIQQSYQNATALYQQAIKGQELYYNGAAYLEVRGTGDEHPYYINDELQPGSINFDNRQFDDVYLMYDIVLDKVVSESPNANMIVLNPQKLKRFRINNRYFERLETDTPPGLPQRGYYEVLYNGETKVVALHTKRLQEKLNSGAIDKYFEARNSYFVLHEGKYHRVKTKGSILKVLRDQKNALKSSIRKNGLRFSENREVSLARIAAYYDELTRK